MRRVKRKARHAGLTCAYAWVAVGANGEGAKADHNCVRSDQISGKSTVSSILRR